MKKTVTFEDGQRITVVLENGPPVWLTVFVPEIGAPQLICDAVNNDPRALLGFPKVIHLRPQ